MKNILIALGLIALIGIIAYITMQELQPKPQGDPATGPRHQPNDDLLIELE